MAVGVAQQTGEQRVSDPGARVCLQGDQRYEPGEDPDVGQGRYDGPFLESLRHPRDDEEVDREQELRGDSQQIGFEDGETNTAENEGEVGARGRRWNISRETDEVERPLLPVLDGLPQEAWTNSLSVDMSEHTCSLGQVEKLDLPVIHVTLAGIISEKTVDQDSLLSVGEPALLATEPVLGLGRTGRHQTPREDADDEGDDTLEEEEPAPTTPSSNTSHLKHTSSNQRPDNVDCAKGCPEERQSDGKLVRFVKVSQPEDDVTTSVWC